MDLYTIPYNLRDALMCLGFLIGVGGGVFLIIRKQAAAGGLAIAGFILFGIDPILEVVIWRIIAPNATNIDVLNWTYVCISAPATFLGTAALIAALVMAARGQGAGQTL